MNMQMMEAAFATNGIPWPNGETANGTATAKRRLEKLRIWNDRWIGPRIRTAALLFSTELITIVPAHWLMETIGLIS